MKNQLILLAFMCLGCTMNAQISLTATAGTPTGNYSTLKQSFDAINAGTHRGVIIINITGSTTETASAILYQSGYNNLSGYSSVRLQPATSNLSISGNFEAPLIDLNGSDNVIIDGRVNGSGIVKSLSLINASPSDSAGNCTVRFINDASSNTIKYCSIKGSTTDDGGGIIFFSTTNGATGNDNNLIDNNDITNAADARRPVNAVYSFGTWGKANSGNIISNNNVFDYFNRSVTSNGLYIRDFSTAWAITGNNFYETTDFIPLETVRYAGIAIDVETGVNFTISNNFIGGNNADHTGLLRINSGNTANSSSGGYDFFPPVFAFTGIYVSGITESTVQNNTIRNINYTGTGNFGFYGLVIITGEVTIGTVSNNTIGAADGTGSISVTNNSNEALFAGIFNMGGASANADIRNNQIAGISTDGDVNIHGIYNFIFSDSGATVISNNLIGSNSIPNSIEAAWSAPAAAQKVTGIFSVSNAAAVTISGNTVMNLKNGTTNSNNNAEGSVTGIATLNGVNSIADNTIRDMTIGNANTNATTNASVTGIRQVSAIPGQSITGNNIYNLANTYSSFEGSVIGLYYEAGPGKGNSVSKNFIQGLSVHQGSTAANLYGVKLARSSVFFNNVISLANSANTTIYGIYESGSTADTSNLYFNTVYIGGSAASGTNKSYAFYSATNNNTRDIRNNIFTNERSTAGGANQHYAAYFNYGSTAKLTLGYNDYFVSGQGAVLGNYNNTNITTLPMIPGMDNASQSVNPVFAEPGDNIATSYAVGIPLDGITGTGINTDYAGVFRSASPQLGAFEQNITLPITLQSFTGYAMKETNQLKWVTSAELNSSHFELQRSENGMQFTRIAIINAAGNSTIPQYYEYADRGLLPANSYYRLKQIDLDGKTLYSRIILISREDAGYVIAVYPNPTTGKLNLVAGKEMKNAGIRIVNAVGQLVAERTSISGTSYSLDISYLVNGVYFMEVYENNKVIRTRIVKQ
ncbi:MAG: T9SS type A sorting domain-containing protein [Chitinophagales bacterium]|nr:T9SS type A sorting domain-containing protein [Chitinophagales bacterium]